MKNYSEILFDRNIFEVNLLPAHSTFRVYESEAAYQEQVTRSILINDGWKGIYGENFEPEIVKYFQKETSLETLCDVQVPLSLELQGYGKPQYVNNQYTFDGYSDGTYGEEISVNNPCMLYLKDYELLVKKADKKYILNFQGSESAMFLYVNGEFVGYSENLFLDSEFDITKQLTEGVNRIALLCFKYSSSTWLLDQDFYRFSGLFRDVTISEVSEKGVYDVEVKSQVDVEAKTSETTITLTCEKKNVVRELHILDAEGNTVWSAKGKELHYTANLSNIHLWDAETPYLYSMLVRSYEEDVLCEIAELEIGFRDVCIEDGVLLFNGKRLIINGINRHEWNMKRGRSVTQADTDFDVQFLKEHNVNAIRTSHYPNNTSFYHACDELGFYVMDEACLESHGSFAWADRFRYETSFPADDETWTDICTSKLMRMYERDKNHPSIIMWSLGNESGFGDVFFHMRDTLKKRDSKAIIHYEHGYGKEEYMKVSDVYSSMYMFADHVDEFIPQNHSDKPYILCEYMHAMGNSLGDMKRYRTLLEKHGTFQGGFIWDYIDQGLLTKDHSGIEKLCYGGDFGERPHDLDFCGNGIILSDRKEAYGSAKANTMKYYYQPIQFELSGDKVIIRNQYLFRDTSHLYFTLDVLCDGNIVETNTFDVNVGAGESEEYSISVEIKKYKGEILYIIRARQKETQYGIRKDKVISSEELVIREKGLAEESAVLTEAPKVIEGHFNIGVHAGDVSYLFRKAGVSYMLAGLYSINVAGEEFLVREALPTVFRPNTSNDIGNTFCFTSSLALSFSKNVRCVNEEIKYGMENNNFVISYRYTFDHSTLEGAVIRYCINGNGEMKVTATLDKLNQLESLPLFGIHFELPKTKDKFSYFGKGPFETYPDRKDGTLSGIYSGICKDEYVDYLYPQECGNHEETRYLIIEGEKADLRFDGNGQNFSFKYLENSDFEIENATHKEELPNSGKNHLTICGFTRGVGGDDSWGAPVHEPYVLKSDKQYTFSFVIQPIVKG